MKRWLAFAFLIGFVSGGVVAGLVLIQSPQTSKQIGEAVASDKGWFRFPFSDKRGNIMD